MNKYNVAVVGATGAVGETLLSILEQRNFPVDQVFALASERSAGNTVMFNNKPLMVTDLAEFDFSQTQIGLFPPAAAFPPNTPQRQERRVVWSSIIPRIFVMTTIFHS
jgi:aspartate-semialdehyde dehydrogenase